MTTIRAGEIWIANIFFTDFSQKNKGHKATESSPMTRQPENRCRCRRPRDRASNGQRNDSP